MSPVQVSDFVCRKCFGKHGHPHPGGKHKQRREVGADRGNYLDFKARLEANWIETTERAFGWRAAAALRCEGSVVLGSCRARPQPHFLPAALTYMLYWWVLVRVRPD